MLDWINVINMLTETKYTYGTGTLIGGIALAIMGLFLMSVVIFYIIQIFKHKKLDDVGAFMTCIIFGVILLMISIFCFTQYFTRTSYKITKYQVTIDDTVKYNEFTNRYDILSHEGNIYIIQNKLDNEIKSK